MGLSRDLVVNILADTSKLNAGVNQANGPMGKLGGTVGKLAGGFVALGAGVAAVDFLQDATKAAEEDKKSQALLANQLKETNKANDAQIASVEDSIDVLSRQSGVADDELRPAFAALARSTGDIEEAQDQLAIAMDVAAGRGIDLETVTKAMEKANNGNTSALSKLGIQMKDTEGNTLSAEAAMAKASETYKGAAEAAVTPGERMSVAFNELKEQVGTALLPVMENLATFMSDTLLPAFQDAVEWVQRNWPDIQKAIEKMWSIVEPILTVMFTFIKTQFDIISGIIKTFSALLSGDFSGAWEAIEETIGKVWENIKTIVTNAIDFLKESVGGVWDIGADAVTGAVNAAIGFFEKAINTGIDLVNTALDLLDKAAGPWVNFGEVGHVKFGRIGGGGGAAPGTGVMAGATSAVKLAEGGIVTRPTLALIGEGGPEAVVPLKNGGMGGTTFNISNLNVTANTPEQLVVGLQEFARRNGGLRLTGGVTAV